MKILVVGSGGREHALVWKLYQSERVERIFVAPGNDGMAELAEIVNIKSNDIKGLADWAEENGIDLTVVGPEEPLVNGIVDEFESRGLRIFGPDKKAARIEGSKVFAKSILKKYNIPTAEFEVFTTFEEALAYLKQAEYPLVIKAEGLAAGKGVFIATDKEKACQAVEKIMEKRIFGDAGQRIVVEDFLEGEEVSVLALTDGKTIIPMVPAQDHKPVFDGDEGPNTGGMGAYSPVPFVGSDLQHEVYENILEPTVRALNKEGIKYKGILYAGLILTDSGPKVLEFNARFGDPETQVIIPRLKTDLVDLIDAVIDEKLEGKRLDWDDRAAVCVVLASGGYPFDYDTGYRIKGLEQLAQYDNFLIFHAGTKMEDGHFVTDGGRVMGITVLGNGLIDAINQVYQAVEDIYFEDMHYRTDIGYKAIVDDY
ncbi:phosphoribosylamine--glycine ligase [Halothermothrix orenii]|uniref:Phosphoribosylamine--glycine ligase n=1 Tax=Halothermothrix orenii (strain H 168 / OCM 544 / DSM 9562) TaxID=373903 RepID=B8D1A2_HALOH|nr:phosphoribosylamine--glycine ligase [Halothermothrix orenii]ACL71054.1 phosphoribosylamine--glycine ligase [Halothermothrix orenii H 168]